jgi:hypothetical protein
MELVALVLHGACQSVKFEPQGRSISRKQARTLLQLWQHEAHRLVEASRRAYLAAGANPLDSEHVQCLNRLTIARSIVVSLEKALWRRIGHAGSLFAEYRIPRESGLLSIFVSHARTQAQS